MLTFIGSTKVNGRCQQQLASELRTSLGGLGKRLITYRPSQALMSLYGRGHSHLYFAPKRQNDRAVFWNAFGIYDEVRRAQEIVVEINISFGSERRTAGCFAQDASGRVFLMHSGRVGGGREGIGQAAFLAWHKPQLVPVDGLSEGTAIVVGELGSQQFANRVEAFVGSVARFKAFVASGEAQTDSFAADTQQWREYRKEFAGRKRAKVTIDLDYVSYHGDVVESLRRWIRRKVDRQSTVTNSPLIDLLVHRDKSLMHVFEVKTGGDRQMLYAGLGQLIVHSGGHARPKRWLVLPEEVALPKDIETALSENTVSLLRFKITKDDKVVIVT